MRKNKEIVNLGSPRRRAVVVTEGPRDLVALEDQPSSHSPTEVRHSGPAIVVHEPGSRADVELIERVLRMPEDALAAPVIDRAPDLGVLGKVIPLVDPDVALDDDDLDDRHESLL